MKILREPPKLLTIHGEHDTGVFVSYEEYDPVLIDDVLQVFAESPCKVDELWRGCTGSYAELQLAVPPLPANQEDFEGICFYVPFDGMDDSQATAAFARYLKNTSKAKLAEYCVQRNHFLEEISNG